MINSFSAGRAPIQLSRWSLSLHRRAAYSTCDCTLGTLPGRRLCHPKHQRISAGRAAFVAVPPGLVLIVDPALRDQMGKRILIERGAFGWGPAQKLFERQSLEVRRGQSGDRNAVPKATLLAEGVEEGIPR